MNDGRGAWDVADAWFAEVEFRIGTRHGDGPDSFGAIYDFAVGPDGRIFVGEILAGEIRVFRPDGVFSHSFGRPGEGPGEFRVVTGVAVSPSGEVWVRDGRLNRFSVFSPNGNLIAIHRMEYRGYLAPWSPSFDQSGRFLDWETPRPIGLGGTASIADYPFTPVRLTPGMEDFERFPPVVDHRRLMTNPPLPPPYEGKTIVHTDRSGTVWFADSDEYRLYWRTLAGDTLGAFTLPLEPQPVTEAEKDSASVNWLSGRRIDRDEVIPTKPVILAITTSPEGHVLVFPRGDGVEAGLAMDVFDGSGVFLGRVPLPEKIELQPVPIVRNQRLYAVVKDELDVPFLVRLRLQSSEG